MRECAGHADDRGFRGDVDRHIDGWDRPGDGTHIDDRAAAGLLHCWNYGLSHEELMFQIDGHRLVPGCRGDVRHRMAGIVAGIIYKHVDGLKSVENLLHRFFQGIDIRQVTMKIHRTTHAEGIQSLDKLLSSRILDIEKGYPRSLHGEGFHDSLTDSAGAAGHHDDAIAKARITGEHSHLFHGADSPAYSI